MKSYYVTIDNEEDTAEIVFAETPGKAKQKTEAYHDVDFTSLRARRLPGLDGKELTDQNIYLYGRFFVCCRECEGIAEGEDGGDPYFDEKGRAYCWYHRPARAVTK